MAVRPISVNESVVEETEDAAELPDLYNRELMRQKHFSLTNTAMNSDTPAGGYREWKSRNGLGNSEGMVSSLGRALRNQGVVVQDESDLYQHHNFHDIQSNSGPLPDAYSKEQHMARLNASEPPYSPNQFRGRANPNEMMHRSDGQSFPRCHMSEIPNGRHYNYSFRDNNEPECIHNEFSKNCSGQCCTNHNIKPMMSSSHNQDTPIRREQVIHLKAPNHSNMPPHNEYHYQSDGISPKRSPTYTVPTHFQTHNNPTLLHCHQSPQSCHCCSNQNESKQSISSHKKCSNNRKTESSIKKLYRILWLQNEQLGLLEKQVSKLIEINFSKQSNEHCNTSNIESKLAPTSVTPKITKNDTCEIGIMTDLPCLKCSDNSKKRSSSESEPEIIHKSCVEESLTLHGVDLPVNREELLSPPASMHIDMQEFQQSSSSDSDDESDTTEDESEPVGWTFYDNVVGQVNNILKSANKKKNKKRNVYSTDMKLTVEQLKRLGIGAPESESTNANKRVTFEQGLKEQQVNLRAQSEISMNFNALASKYLTSAGGKVQDISMCNVISNNTNMSMATLRYLERHQIANDVLDVLPKKSQGVKMRKGRSSGDKAVTSKFLDITAIRQQPKLLPKEII